MPRRFDNGLLASDFHSSPVSFYKQIYYEALDLMINCVKEDLTNLGIGVFSPWKHYSSRPVCKRILSLNSMMCAKLTKVIWIATSTGPTLTLGVSYSQAEQEESKNRTSVFNIREYLQSLSTAQMSQVTHLMQLLLVIPAMNASSEHSFSALRRVKMYLRTTMTQERLNHIMVLHEHKDSTNSLDLKTVVNDFIDCSEHRSSIFARF